MSNLAIRVESLGKRYFFGQQRRYTDLRQTLSDATRTSFRALAFALKSHDATAVHPWFKRPLWALRQVDFEVKHGDVVGIMGDNGSGKTTLLRVLSRITCPTEGHVEIHGRVGTLLDVGAGFHGELTGRENIYVNGAILGMARAEIEHNFDEIVAFAELEDFIGTPLKHYSTGMRARLAFAVAVHLESEILLIDEVLAVGDRTFRAKCLQKMADAVREGRTVAFVSHDLEYIRQFCNRGIVFAGGRVVCVGSALEAADYYSSTSARACSDHLAIVQQM